MTRDEVLQKWESMEPRERDAWVAEAVLGHEVTQLETGSGAVPKIRGFRTVPPYTTDMGAAWEVAEEIGLFCQTRLRYFLYRDIKGIVCEDCPADERQEKVWVVGEETWVHFRPVVYAGEAPDAICLAALFNAFIEEGEA